MRNTATQQKQISEAKHPGFSRRSFLAIPFRGFPSKSNPNHALRKIKSGASSMKSEVYFGLSKPGGETISDKDWKAFADECIVPVFSDGMTTQNGVGQWRMKTGESVTEPTKILLVLHEYNDAIYGALAGIADAYKVRFDQEAVLLISSRVGMVTL